MGFSEFLILVFVDHLDGISCLSEEIVCFFFLKKKKKKKLVDFVLTAAFTATQETDSRPLNSLF